MSYAEGTVYAKRLSSSPDRVVRDVSSQVSLFLSDRYPSGKSNASKQRRVSELWVDLG